MINKIYSIKYINDTFGTAEGDKQIKSAANILIKTQPDNSDIIRTDGNEYLIYLVGYEEKRVVSYIRKLYKEFNNLPYEYGAAVGYSMRTDDLKTIQKRLVRRTCWYDNCYEHVDGWYGKHYISNETCSSGYWCSSKHGGRWWS